MVRSDRQTGVGRLEDETGNTSASASAQSEGFGLHMRFGAPGPRSPNVSLSNFDADMPSVLGI